MSAKNKYCVLQLEDGRIMFTHPVTSSQLQDYVLNPTYPGSIRCIVIKVRCLLNSMSDIRPMVDVLVGHVTWLYFSMPCEMWCRYLTALYIFSCFKCAVF